MRILATKLGLPLHRRPTVGADIQHRDTIENATIALCVCVEHLDDEPLLWMSVTDLGPAHASP